MDAIVLASVSLLITVVNAFALDRLIENTFHREFDAYSLPANEAYRLFSVKIAQSVVTVLAFVTTVLLLTVSIFQVYVHLNMFWQFVAAIVYVPTILWYLAQLIFGGVLSLHDPSRIFLRAASEPRSWSKNRELNVVLIFVATIQLMISIWVFLRETPLS